MKGYVINNWINGPDDMKVVEAAVPEPKNGELLIEVKAAGLNFFDILQVQGRYQHKPPFPFVPGGEYAGVVLKSTVPEYKAGDRVFGAGNSFAEQVVVDAKRCIPIPSKLTFEEAAGLYVTYPTSYAALVLRANLKANEICLVHAAAGGVGIAAVQIAKALGATVIATAGSAEKLEVAKKYGADYCINYRDKDWTNQVKKITNGHGADVVYDPVGLIDESMKCTAWCGRILVIGFAKGSFEKVAVNRVLLKNISLIGLHWGAYFTNEQESIPKVWSALLDLFDSGKLKPAIYNKVYNLQTIPEGLKAIANRETFAKVVARVSGPDSKI
ncbi:unnamed protein product [Umbelopsis vinacea]